MSSLTYWQAKLATRKKRLAAGKAWKKRAVSRVVKANAAIVYRTKLVDEAEKKVADLIAQQGPSKSIAWANKYVGVTESPAGSNKGPYPISDCQKLWLGHDGYYWCGAFAGYALLKGGLDGLVGKYIVYTPSIVADAKAGRNGFASWHPISEAKPGDLALYDWNKGDNTVANHVELVVKNLGNGQLECIGGNTAKGGTNNNGGGIYRQVRSAGLIGVARPRW